MRVSERLTRAFGAGRRQSRHELDYLNGATSLTDLEGRQREIDRGLLKASKGLR